MGESRTLLRPMAVLLVLCVAALVFLKLAGEVREGETQGVDEWVLRSLRTPGDPAVPIGPAWLPAATGNLSALGSVSVLLFVVVAVAGFLALARLWRNLLLVLGAAAGGLL
jgi:undecaprenyl-diphosphatase